MALLRTLVLTPTFTVVRHSVTYTNATNYQDSQLIHVHNRAARPAYRFELALEPLFRTAAEELEHFHAFHQGGKSFLFSGGPYATIENYNLFGEGDGVQRQFYVPNRYLNVNSFRIQTQNQVTATTSEWAASSSNSWPFSLNATPGIVTFANSTPTIPLSGHDVQAKFSCQYRCVFEPDGFKIEEVARNIYKANITLQEVFLLT